MTKSSLAQKVVLIFFGLVLSIVLLETGLRFGGFVWTTIQEHRNRISMSQTGTCRILCLGESTTAMQYPAYLAEILNQHNIGIQFSVIDKGCVAARTDTIAALLQSNLDTYRPDIVITMMGINDSGAHMSYEVKPRSKGFNFLKSCRAYKLARLLWLHLLAKLTETVKPEASSPKDDQSILTGGTLSAYDKMIELAMSCRDENRFFELEKLFKSNSESNPSDERPYIFQGTCYRERGKFVEAEASYAKAMALNPRNDNIYLELGNSYRKQKKFSEAESTYIKGMALNPKNDNLYVELGNAYRRQDEYFRAAAAFKKALEINPKNKQAYFELGNFYRRLGQYSAADKPHKNDNEVEQQDLGPYSEAEKPGQTQERYFEALELLQRHRAFYPESDRAYGAIEGVYRDMGDLQHAAEYRDKAVAVRLSLYNPNTVNNYRVLRGALKKKGITYVCAQYPMRDIDSLKKIFAEDPNGIIFVDSEKIFKEAVQKEGYAAYFGDMFAGDFGHCTEKGNRLLAKNIADTILKEVFGK